MTLQQNLRNWVSDRLENNEPLMLSEFKSFMQELGYSKSQLNKFLTPSKVNRLKLIFKNKKIKYTGYGRVFG